jgi:hypothetical protein
MGTKITLPTSNKTRDLVLGIVFDLLGMVSFTIPIIGEFEDVVWAPLAGYLMTWMYKGKVGRAAGIVTFLEEILPFTDVIPTFTIMWFYTYLLRKKNN